MVAGKQALSMLLWTNPTGAHGGRPQAEKEKATPLTPAPTSTGHPPSGSAQNPFL
jgi:hypothetical protein